LPKPANVHSSGAANPPKPTELAHRDPVAPGSQAQTLIAQEPVAHFATATKPSKPTELTVQPTLAGFDGFDSFAGVRQRESDAVADDFSTAEPWLRLFGGQVAQRRDYPIPTGLGAIAVPFDGRQISLTLAHHNCRGVNRLGQHSTEFPYCAINLAAWRERPFDPAHVRWYKSRRDVLVNETAESEDKSISETLTSTWFRGGVRVEIRRSGSNRWYIWAAVGAGRLMKRTDSATPHLEHGRRTAEHWFGKPIDGWKSITNVKESK